jgi:hypothetical protein
VPIEADRKAAPAHEPVGQKQRLAGVAEADAAAADQHADRQVKMPWLRRQRRQQQTAAHQDDAKLHDGAGTMAIHHAADQRTQHARNQKAKRKGSRRDPAFPAELPDDWREQQRKSRTGRDANCHGDERHRNDDPTVKEGKPHQEACFLSGAFGARPSLLLFAFV